MNYIRLKPIVLSNEIFRVAPIHEQDLNRLDQIVENLFQMFNDTKNIPFNPEKRIKSLEGAKKLLEESVFNFSISARYNHFITYRKNQTVIGYISIIPPYMAEDVYLIKDTWFIEYYLHNAFWNYGLMTTFITEIVNNLRMQNIKDIGAVVNKNNIGSIKVLEKCNFEQSNFPIPEKTHFFYKLK